MAISFQITDFLSQPYELRSKPRGLQLRSGRVISKLPVVLEKREIFSQLHTYVLRPGKKHISSLQPSLQLLQPDGLQKAVKTALCRTKRPLFEQLKIIDAILGKKKADTFLQAMVAE